MESVFCLPLQPMPYNQLSLRKDIISFTKCKKWFPFFKLRDFSVLYLVNFSVWLILRSVYDLLNLAGWRVCVFERSSICDVMAGGCMTKISVLILVTTSWKWCVWVYNFDIINLVHRRGFATWKADLEILSLPYG